MALVFAGAFVIISQLKMNVTNAGPCGLDRLVELLLAADPQPPRPGGVAGVQRDHRVDADGTRHLQDARAHPGPLFDRGGGMGQRAGRRSGDQQAARAQPPRHRVQARAPLRHQSGRRRRHADRDGGRHRGLLRRSGGDPAIAVGVPSARRRLRHGSRHRLRDPRAASTWRGRRAGAGTLWSGDPLLDLRARVRDRGHGALSGLFGLDLLAVLLAGDPLPGLLQAAGADVVPSAASARAPGAAGADPAAR